MAAEPFPAALRGIDAATWQARIEVAPAAAPCTRADLFVRAFKTFSLPAHLGCTNGMSYVVKALRSEGRGDAPVIAKSLITDHVVGRLGISLGAPVGTVDIVDISAEFLSTQPELTHMKPGPAHASQFIDSVSERRGVTHVVSNRRRFASLAVLYGMCAATDHQFVYEERPPHVVHSVDHGHFWGGPMWTASLLERYRAAAPDSIIVQQCGLTAGDLLEASAPLRALTPDAIVAAVAAPPAEWGISISERVVIACYIARQRDALLASLGLLMQGA